MARLTSNQKELLQAVVSGRVGGMILNSVPAMVKRGLITETVEDVWRTTHVPFGIRNRGQGHNIPTAVYRLTEEGRQAYVKMRTKQYKSRLAKLEQEFASDLNRALAQAKRTGK